MKVPLSWLRDYVEFNLAPEALSERLTMLGMEVKGIERWGGDWQNVVVGELLSVEKHPRADRLSLTTVRVGDGEPLAIVCGATNIAVGQRVPVALPGAILPGGRRIDRTEKMGATSDGMLCSGDELNLTGDADGILILAPDAPIGMALSELYGDTVLDVDVKPNRGDALSLIGLAREVAALTDSTVRWPDTDPIETGPRVEQMLMVEVRDADLCPRFAGRFVGGVTIGPSPDRVQMRLRAAGVRPISSVVDASNYVMVELGKPIHTYDATGVGEHDGRHRLIVRRATPGERLTTLDHVERTLDPEALLIADDRGPLGIAGIMGGAVSEVSDATTDVIIESAIFDPVAIRRTGQRYGLRSEASLRFEKGVEFRLARIGADRTARLIADWAGGSVARGRVDSAPDEPAPARVPFRPNRVNRLLGDQIPVDEQRAVLGRVGIETEPPPLDDVTIVPVATEPKPLTVTSPASEAVIAIEADVAEEIARVRGYEQIPGILPHTPMPAYRSQPFEVPDHVRETFAGAGLTEVVSHALVSPRQADRFAWETPLPMVAGGSPAGGGPIHVTNPLSADHSVLRPTVVGSLVEIASTNLRRGRPGVGIFELGKGYGRDGDAVNEWSRLALLACGVADEPSWNQPERPWDLDDAKGMIELLCRRLGIEQPRYETLSGEPLLHPGRAARVVAERDGELALAGLVGELHPAVADEWELRGVRVIVAELDVAGLSGGEASAVQAEAPTRQPAAARDLAIVVAESRSAAVLSEAIRQTAGPDLVSLRLFDIYRGSPLAADQKSLAWRLIFQSRDRTLTEAEIDAAIARIAEAVGTVGGRIRT